MNRIQVLTRIADELETSAAAHEAIIERARGIEALWIVAEHQPVAARLLLQAAAVRSVIAELKGKQ